MVTDKLQKLRQYQKQMAQLEKELSRFNSKLLALPAKYGFKTMNSFIEALRAAAGTGASASGSTARSVAASSTPSGRKPRAVITPETKQKLKALVKDGKTGSEIAEELNISLPSVQNIKKELGLVKKRG